MAALVDVARVVAERLRVLPGIVSAPTNPTEQLPEHGFPALLVYPIEGAWGPGSANDGSGNRTIWGLHTIVAEVHVQRTDLPTNVDAAMPYADTVPAALFRAFFNDRIGGTVVCLGDSEIRGPQRPLRYEFAALGWGAVKTLGWRFALDVSVEEIVP